MATPFQSRKVGTPRLNPVQQLGGVDVRAIRNVGQERLLSAFSNFSSTLATFGQQQSKEAIEKAVAEGQAWRKQSKKDFRAAVSDGTIHPTQNPWFAVGAMQADGEITARSLTTQWFGEWEAEIANPESTVAREQGGFEAFMQERLDAHAAEDPFVSYYQSNAFYDIANGFVTNNAIKQNQEARERELLHTSSTHVDNLLDLAASDVMTVTDPGGPLSAQSVQTPQMAYDSLYESGALTPFFKTLLLERTYVAALNQQEVSPEFFVERIRNLKQGNSTLGETKEGQDINASALGSKVREATNRWQREKTAELRAEASSYLVTHFEHSKELSNVLTELELLMNRGEDPSAFVQDSLEKFQATGPYVLEVLGLEEYEKWKVNFKEAALDIQSALVKGTQHSSAVSNFVSSGNFASAEDWYQLSKTVGGTTKRDDLTWPMIQNSPNKVQILANILGHSTYLPLDRHFLGGLGAAQSGYTKKPAPADVPQSLVDLFGLYAQIRGASSGATEANIFKDNDSIVGVLFADAYEELGPDLESASLAMALSNAFAAPESQVRAQLGSGAGSRFSGIAGGVRPTQAEADTLEENFTVSSMPPGVQASVLAHARTKMPSHPGSKKQAFESAVKETVDNGEIVTADGFTALNAPILIQDENRLEEFRSGWVREDFANAANQPEYEAARDQFRSEEARAFVQKKLNLPQPLPPDASEEALVRLAVWEIMGGSGSVPSGPADERFTSFFNERYSLIPRALFASLMQTDVEAQAALDRDQFRDGVAGLLFGSERVTLQGLLDRAPQETLTYLREQEWYDEKKAVGLRGYVDPDNLYISYLPNGGAMVYVRENEDSPYEPFLGGATGPTRNITAAQLERASKRYLDFAEESKATTKLLGKSRRDVIQPSADAVEQDKITNAFARGFGKMLGLEIKNLNIAQKIDAAKTQGALLLIEGLGAVSKAVLPTDYRTRREYYSFHMPMPTETVGNPMAPLPD